MNPFDVLGRDFVICSSERWQSGSQTSKHHLTRQLLKQGARVLYVENISMRSFGSGGGRDFAKAWNKLRSFFRGLVNPMPNLFCFTPVYLPFPRSSLARHFNQWLLPALLRMHLRRLGMRHPVYIYFMPTGVQLQGQLGERLAAYYIVDNFAAFADVEQDTMRTLEAQALERANVVFATSQTLQEDRKGVRPDIHFSPHGVDFDHFARVQDPTTVVPPEVAALPTPRIGFMGGLAHDSVDLELIREIARARRDWQVVTFGRALCDISALTAEPNIAFLGPKPYDEMPEYLKGLDVALIPFLVNDLTRDLNPLKLREYLAAGMPVVATDLPPLREYAPNVRCTLGIDGFLSEIEDALTNPGDPRQRQAAVKAETWEARANAVLDALAGAAVALPAGKTRPAGSP